MKLSELIRKEIINHSNVKPDAIVAAITARLHECVKPLVWSEPSEDPYQHQMSGSYEVTDAGHLYFHGINRGDISTDLIARFDTIEAAKAAAQAHYAEQIIAGLDLRTNPPNRG